jgi:hypothetical protein
VGLNSIKSLNLTNVYPNNKNKNKNKNKKKNNKVKSKPLELRSRVKNYSNKYSNIAYPKIRSHEAADVFGVDQAIHMDDLAAFLGSQIYKGQKNLILWYDYLNPTHRYVSICSKRSRNILFCAHATSHDATFCSVITQPLMQHFVQCSRNLSRNILFCAHATSRDATFCLVLTQHVVL